jgi:predicted RNA-binding protein with PIN domain
MLLSYIYRLNSVSEKRDKYVYDAQYVSRRQAERDYSRRIPVSFTMEKELYDMVDDLIDRKVFKDRTHALNAAVDYLKWTLQNNPMLFYGPRNKQ